MNVAVVYHFLAHYRAPVFMELLNHSDHNYILCADTKNRLVPGVPVWIPDDAKQFRECPTSVFRGHLVWQRGLISLAQDPSIDTIIYLGDWKWPSTWASARLAKAKGKRILFWTHGWRGKDQGATRFLRKRFYRLADGLLLYGNWAKQTGCEEGFDSKNLYVVYNSAGRNAGPVPDSAQIDRKRAELFPQSPPQTPVVCCCSRLTPRRRLDMLLRAASQLNDVNHSVNLLLIGDGPERKPLEQMSSDLGLNVRFTGECYDPEILATYYGLSNVAVSPGSIGLTAIHSMSHGIPVISHDHIPTQLPEAEAIVSGETGDLFRAGDEVDLANKIRDWTRTPCVESHVSNACRSHIDERYVPRAQRTVIDAAVAGEDADRVADRLATRGESHRGEVVDSSSAF